MIEFTSEAVGMGCSLLGGGSDCWRWGGMRKSPLRSPKVTETENGRLIWDFLQRTVSSRWTFSLYPAPHSLVWRRGPNSHPCPNLTAPFCVGSPGSGTQTAVAPAACGGHGGSEQHACGTPVAPLPAEGVRGSGTAIPPSPVWERGSCCPHSASLLWQLRVGPLGLPQEVSTRALSCLLLDGGPQMFENLIHF